MEVRLQETQMADMTTPEKCNDIRRNSETRDDDTGGKAMDTDEKTTRISEGRDYDKTKCKDQR
jgi:hypothetical protein